MHVAEISGAKDLITPDEFGTTSVSFYGMEMGEFPSVDARCIWEPP